MILTPKVQQLTFDLQDKNKLHPLFTENMEGPIDHPSFCGFIGKYDGRNDGIYQLKAVENKQLANGIFVFILSGAFDVQNRFLHARDGLALSDLQDELIEFEALSNDAILLLMEIPMV